MRVLLLGGYGLLGEDIFLAFQQRGHDIIRPPRAELNLLNRIEIIQAVHSLCPDMVIHSAGFTDVLASESDVDAAFTHNCVITYNVVNAVKGTNVPLVFFSTDYVFGGEKGEPYSEDDTKSPVNHYGWTKLVSEDIVRANHDAHYIIRTSWLFGAYGRCFPRSVITRLLGGERVEVVNDQIGSPTNTADLSEALSTMGDLPYGTYHITNSGFTTWFEFARYLAVCLKLDADHVVPVSTDNGARTVARPKYSVLSNSKWQQYRRPLRDYRVAVEEFLKLHFEHGRDQ